MRVMKKTEENNIKECIKKWFELYDKKEYCPGGLTARGFECDVCKLLFPSLSIYRTGTCPCNHLSYKYVVKRARRFLKEGFKDESDKRTQKVH